MGVPPYDLDFGLCEDMKVVNVGGRHLGNHGIQHELYEDDDEFWTTKLCSGLLMCMCPHK